MLGQQQQSVLGNGLKLVGELFVPGAAELLEGKMGSGLAHNVIAGAATLVLLPVSPVLAGVTVLAVKANSYARSVTGRGLFAALSGALENGGARGASGSQSSTTSTGV